MVIGCMAEARSALRPAWQWQGHCTGRGWGYGGPADQLQRSIQQRQRARCQQHLHGQIGSPTYRTAARHTRSGVWLQTAAAASEAANMMAGVRQLLLDASSHVDIQVQPLHPCTCRCPTLSYRRPTLKGVLDACCMRPGAAWGISGSSDQVVLLVVCVAQASGSMAGLGIMVGELCRSYQQKAAELRSAEDRWAGGTRRAPH